MSAAPLGSVNLAGLAPLPQAALIGHLPPASQYAVRRIAGEQRGRLVLERYLVAAGRYRGAEIALHVQLCLADPDDPRIVLSIPGGRGAFAEETLWWLAGEFGGNYAALDWIGRGRSPPHPHLRCDYDPIYMAGDEICHSYMFHNLAAIWAVLDWLFANGRCPADLVGGSWGGVYAFLLAALDRRVERIFPTFGCGGMALPGIEKRSMWDAALEQMGPARSRRWAEAFDPILRLDGIAAAVNYGTASNDKFFSLDMAMATWSRVANRDFLALVANQDHTMRPFGTQPYVVQRAGPEALAACRAMEGRRLSWDARLGEVAAAPLDPGEAAVLMWSEQDAARGNMSREWFAATPASRAGGAAVFKLAPSSPDAAIMCYLSRTLRIGGRAVVAATPVFAAGAGVVRTPPPRRLTLIEAAGTDPWQAPVGDKSAAAIAADDKGWAIRFAAGTPLARATRFGIRPWLLPPGWQAVELVLAEPVDPAAYALHLCLSRRYQHLDEEAVAQPFGAAEPGFAVGRRILRFHRAHFAPAIVVEPRFRRRALPSAATILDDFDAVGIVDLAGAVTASLVVVALAIE